MANQVTVSNDHSINVTIEPPANVQVQVSRAVIGTIANVPTANFANYAGNVTVSAQPNITSLGTLTSLTSNGNITAPFFVGNVVGNISGNITVPGTNTAVLFNQLGNAGASDALKFNYASNVLTANGNIVANYFIGNGSQLTGIVVPQSNNANFANFANFAGNAFSVSGSNVTGAVSYATTANSVAGANVSGAVAYAAIANSVALANVSGAGNIASINITGNTSQILYGNGVFAAAPNVSNVANANYANFAGEAFSVSASNIVGTVNLANFATTANAVAGANVSGAVANATYANTSGSATTAGTVTTNAQPNITSVGTLTGLTVSGNILPNANITYDLGNNTNRFKDLYLAGNSIILGAQTISANATGISVTGNLSGDASGLANITGANVTGQVGNALIAGTVYTNAQPNITSVGNLTSLTVSGDAGIAGNLTVGGNISYVNVNNLVVQDPVIELGGGPNGAPLTTNDGKDRGTLLHYYTTNPVDAFMGWDNGNGEFAFGSNVTNNLDVMTFNTLGNVRAQTFIGNLTGLASSATVANSANSVAGANVSGQVNYAQVANSVAVANVSGIGNIATLNLDGNLSNILYGNGVFAAVPNISNVANANFANFAGNAFSVSGSNVSGAVAFATTANSVALSNVSGAGNIASINLDGNVSNLLTGNGTFVAIPTVSSNANYANFAGTVITNAQPNITSVGTLTSLSVTGNVSANAYQLTTSPGTLTPVPGQMVWDAAQQTVSLGMNNGVIQQVGLENYVLIKASATITDGQVVMFTGANGDNVTGAPANTASAGFRPEYIIGVATQNIANNDTGYITVFGTVNGLNTNAYNVGDILWVDNTTPGALTATRPSDPNFQIEIAAVTKKSSGDGHIQVRVTTFNDINSLTDVTITTPSNGQALVYSGNIWVNGIPNIANTAYSVSGANVSGAVAFATTANSVAGANVSGAVGLASFATVANSVSGSNVTSQVANALIAGTVYTNAQPNITSVGTLSSLAISGNVTSNNANLGNLVTANFFSGNGSLLTGIVAAGGANISNGNSNVSISTAGGNVTVGVNGTSNVMVISNNSANITGTLDASVQVIAPLFLGNRLAIDQSTLTGNSPGLQTIGTWNNSAVTFDGVIVNYTDTASNANSNLLRLRTTSVDKFTVNKSGNVTFAGVISGNAGGLTNIPVGNLSANVNFANTAGTVTTNAQPNITSVGVLSDLNIDGTLGLTVSNTSNTAGRFIVSQAQGAGTGLTANQYNVITQKWNNSSVQFTTLQLAATDVTSNANSLLFNATTNAVSKFSINKSGNVTFAGILTGDGGGLSNIAGGGSPGGSNTQLQFNNAGSFGGISTVTWDGSNISLGAVGTVKVTGGVNNEVIRTDGTGNLSFSSIAQTLLVGTRAGPYTVPITNYTFQVTTRSSGNVTVYVN